MSRYRPVERDLEDDRALLEAHRAGDAEAFGVLFARHRDRLWAVALRTTGNPEDAADAVQEAMISAFRGADAFRAEAAVTTWLHRIVVNACLDRLRRNKVRSAQPLPDDLEEYAGRGAVLADRSSSDPEAEAISTEQRRAVIGALDLLPAEQKAALVLVDMEGYPVEEAARILECPAGTVKSRCSRGRARLAGLLLEAGITGTSRAPGASHQGPRANRETAAPESAERGSVQPSPPEPPRGGDHP
ncbi:MAG: RNA polymerase sigma factor SigM [Actinomycetota bacterium]|nr:RNA polymerase sigma factor SigM [Actinomycetota bacterium]